MTATAAGPMLDAETLRVHVDYDAETGIFIRRLGRVKGAKAGTRHCRGYISLYVAGKHYLAHRLAWLYVHGYWPANDIDHINGIRTDNRIANLREATRSENCQNIRRPPKHNTTGLLGVSRKNKRWHATIRFDGRTRHIGYFSTAEEAHAAYLKEKGRLHPFAVICNEQRDR